MRLMTALPSEVFLSALTTFTGAAGVISSNVLLSFGFAFTVQMYYRNSVSGVCTAGWTSQTMFLIVFGPTFFTSIFSM